MKPNWHFLLRGRPSMKLKLAIALAVAFAMSQPDARASSHTWKDDPPAAAQNEDLKRLDNAQLWNKYIRELKEHDTVAAARTKVECQRRLAEQRALDLIEDFKRRIVEKKMRWT